MVNNLNQDTLGKSDSFMTSHINSTKDVICRLFFLRHGKTLEDGLQLPDVDLSPVGKNEMDYAGRVLNFFGCSEKDTLLLYSPGADENNPVKRIIESKEILDSHKLFKQEIIDHRLDTTPKIVDENGNIELAKDHIAGVASQFANITEITNCDILDSFKSKDGKYNTYKNIVLLSHKSNEGILQIGKDRTDVLDLRNKKIQTGEIIEFDIGTNNKIINYDKEKDVLFLNTKNIDEILSILLGEVNIYSSISLSPNQCSLYGSINAFLNGNINIYELQNSINHIFSQHPELYIQFLTSSNEDLRVFCLANLLISEKYENIADLYLTSNQPLSQAEKELMLLNFDIFTEKFLIHSFVFHRSSRSDTDKILFEKNNLLHFYNSFVVRRNRYDKVMEIQERSLDESIKNHKENAILDRNIYVWKEHNILHKNTSSLTEKKYDFVDISLNDISLGLHLGKKYVLPAHVGSGKSIWLTEFFKTTLMDGGFSFLFYEGKDFNAMSLHDININLGRISYTDILFIDAIDEIYDRDKRNAVKKIINTRSGGALVTSRLSEYNEKDNPGFETLSMQCLTKEEFLNNKISNEDVYTAIVQKLDQSNLSSEVEGNPLLLNFICMLANQETKIKYIKSLSEILNKSDLYENIIKLILFKHQETKIIDLRDIKEVSHKKILELMHKLSNFAYSKFNKEPIEDYMSRNYLEDQDLEDINMLFKQSYSGEYEFIHKSFEDFFLSRCFAYRNDGFQSICFFRDKNILENTRNEWLNFNPTIICYGEILLNNSCDSENESKINDLFGENGLLLNDDAFNSNFWILFELVANAHSTNNFVEFYIEHINKLSNYDILLNFEVIERIMLKTTNNAIKSCLLNIIDGRLYDWFIEQKDSVKIKFLVYETKITSISIKFKTYLSGYLNRDTCKDSSFYPIFNRNYNPDRPNNEYIHVKDKDFFDAYIKKLFISGEFSYLLKIYNIYIVGDNLISLDEKKAFLDKIRSLKDFREDDSLLPYMIISLVNLNYIDPYLNEILDIVDVSKNFEVICRLAEINNNKIFTYIKGYIDFLLKKGEFDDVIQLYTKLSKLDNNEIMSHVKDFLYRFSADGLDGDVHTSLLFLYISVIIASNNTEMLIDNLLKKGVTKDIIQIFSACIKYSGVNQSNVVNAFIRIGDPEYIVIIAQSLIDLSFDDNFMFVKSCADVFFDKQDYYIACYLYTFLSKYGNQKTLKLAQDCIFLSDDTDLTHLESIIDNVSSNLIEDAYSYLSQGEYKAALNIYSNLLESGNQNNIKHILRGIDKLSYIIEKNGNVSLFELGGMNDLFSSLEEHHPNFSTQDLKYIYEKIGFLCLELSKSLNQEIVDFLKKQLNIFACLENDSMGIIYQFSCENSFLSYICMALIKTGDVSLVNYVRSNHSNLLILPHLYEIYKIGYFDSCDVKNKIKYYFEKNLNFYKKNPTSCDIGDIRIVSLLKSVLDSDFTSITEL